MLHVARGPKQLSDYSAEALVEAIIALTHQAHYLAEMGDKDALESVRASRNLARDELIRRASL